MANKSKIRKVCRFCNPHCVRICNLSKYLSDQKRHPTCPKCGFPYTTENSDCANCGFIPLTKCIKCGGANLINSEKCAHCGFSPPKLSIYRYSFSLLEQDKTVITLDIPPPGETTGIY